MQDNGFLPWTKAFEAAGVIDGPKNARGYWGYSAGKKGLMVCSVWDNEIQVSAARAHVPRENRGGYREAAENSKEGNEVIVILRSRRTQLGKVMPTLWRIKSKCLDRPNENSIGFLLLENTGTPF